MRKFHSKNNMAYGIFLRFGSLTDDSKVFHTFTQIRYMTGIPEPSMVRIIRKWRSLGKDINLYNTKITRNRWPLTLEQELFLTSAQTIQEMAHMNLEKRAQFIKEKFNLQSFCNHSVLKLYKKYKICRDSGWW